MAHTLEFLRVLFVLDKSLALAARQCQGTLSVEELILCLKHMVLFNRAVVLVDCDTGIGFPCLTSFPPGMLFYLHLDDPGHVSKGPPVTNTS